MGSELLTAVTANCRFLLGCDAVSHEQNPTFRSVLLAACFCRFLVWLNNRLCKLNRYSPKRQSPSEIYIVVFRAVSERQLCKQRPLLGNARTIYARNIRTVFSVDRAAAVSRQQLDEHVPAATDTHATI
jgi:hypothetical protein